MAPHLPCSAHVGVECAPEEKLQDAQDFEIGIEDHIAIEADILFESLVHEAINIRGDHGIPHKDIPVSKDEAALAKFREGRAFFHRNFFGCALAIVFTELVQFPIQRITSFVVRNETYNGPNFAYLRGVVSLMHILKWFERGIEDKVSANTIYMMIIMIQLFSQSIGNYGSFL
jgi:hypothetical protein